MRILLLVEVLLHLLQQVHWGQAVEERAAGCAVEVTLQWVVNIAGAEQVDRRASLHNSLNSTTVIAVCICCTAKEGGEVLKTIILDLLGAEGPEAGLTRIQ